MSYSVIYSTAATRQLRGLRAFDRAAVIDAIETILTINPTLESQAKVKVLRQPAPTAYRLRVNEVRIYYDVVNDTVYIVQILGKPDSLRYLGG
jgi:mRNA-degrading endonuclease RelE of RelBE toxin-antitoxin system